MNDDLAGDVSCRISDFMTNNVFSRIDK